MSSYFSTELPSSKPRRKYRSAFLTNLFKLLEVSWFSLRHNYNLKLRGKNTQTWSRGAKMEPKWSSWDHTSWLQPSFQSCTNTLSLPLSSSRLSWKLLEASYLIHTFFGSHQLSMYKFDRVYTLQKSTMVYHHPLFQKGREYTSYRFNSSYRVILFK